MEGKQMKFKKHVSWIFMSDWNRDEIIDSKLELLAKYLGLEFEYNSEDALITLQTKGITKEQVADTIENQDADKELSK